MDHTVGVVGLIIGALGVLAAVLFGIIAARQGKAKTVDRPSLRLTTDVQKVTTGIDLPELDIYWGGVPVIEPYFVRFRVTNLGTADLTSTTFDQGRPITATATGARLVAQLSDVEAGWKANPINESSFTLTYGPELIKQGQSIDVRLLVSRKPDIEWSYFFADTPVAQQTEAEAFITYRNDYLKRYGKDRLSPLRSIKVEFFGVAVAVAALLLTIYILSNASSFSPPH